MYSTSYGYRPKSDYGEGDLYAPWAEGDVVYVEKYAEAFRSGRLRGEEGLYIVIAIFSVGEGDDWYLRLAPEDNPANTSDRLHVLETDTKCNYMLHTRLVKTSDSQGLKARKKHLGLENIPCL